MAYDTMLYRATITYGATVTLNQIIGPSTIRQGYGKARLVSAQAFHHSTDADDANAKIIVEFKNNTWVRSTKLVAGEFNNTVSHARNTKNYMYMHGYQLQENSTFIVTATSLDGSAYDGTVTVDLLLTVDYDAIPSVNPDNYAGCPITMECTQAAAFSASANVLTRLGSYDILDPGVVYCINEVYSTNVRGMMYVIIGGLQPQGGLVRVLPCPDVVGICPSILGSVSFTKQSFDVSIISDVAISSQIVPVYLELLASTNSLA